MTEEQLVAGEEEGAASIVEVYAALLLGFVTESDLAQQKASSSSTIFRTACSILAQYPAHTHMWPLEQRARPLAVKGLVWTAMLSDWPAKVKYGQRFLGALHASRQGSGCVRQSW